MSYPYLKELIRRNLPKPVHHKLRQFTYYIKVLAYEHFGLTPLPRSVAIDPGNVCNLKCPLCPTGIGKLAFKRKMMDLDLFQKVVDQMPTVEWVFLFSWGEPFLNPRIFDMIHYASSKNKKIELHTNFSFKRSDKFFEKLIDSGLTHLVISIDGARQSSYEKYRVKGDLDLVISNIRALKDAQNRLRKLTPSITWKMIINRFNEGEENLARAMAQELGVNFMATNTHLSEVYPDFQHPESLEKRKTEWLPKAKSRLKRHYRNGNHLSIRDGVCPFLFDAPAVSPSGKLMSCTMLTDEKSAFGDLTQESFQKIWTNQKYQFARSLFTRSGKLSDKDEIVCQKCELYRFRNEAVKRKKIDHFTERPFRAVPQETQNG